LLNNTASGNTLQNAVFYFSGTAPTPAFATAAVDSAAAALIASALMAGNAAVQLTKLDSTLGDCIVAPSPAGRLSGAWYRLDATDLPDRSRPGEHSAGDG